MISPLCQGTMKLIFALFLFASFASANVVIQAVRTAQAPVIDGQLSEECWRNAPVIGGFTVKSAQRPAQFQTQAYIVYDDTHVYIGVRCAEPDPGNIVVSQEMHREDDVFSDDSVEVLFSPHPARETYFQFGVNPSGAKFDAFRKHGGMAEFGDWKGEWQAKSVIGDDFWSCEIAIPFYTLELDDKAGTTWVFNICRDKKQPQEYSSIAADGAFHDLSKFAQLENMQVNLSRYQFKLGTPEVTTKQKRGVLYSTVHVPVINHGKSDSTVLLRCTRRGAEDQVSVKTRKVTLQPGQRTTVDFSPFADDGVNRYSGDFEIALMQREGEEILSQATKNISVAFQPINVDIVQPFYRNTIYATQQLDEIVADLKLNLDPAERAHCWVKATLQSETDKAELESITLASLSEDHVSLRLPTAKLTEGHYLLSIILGSKDNAEIASVRERISKVAPFHSEVRFDENHNMFIDGVPVFGLGYFSPAKGGDSIAAEQGCNTIMEYNSIYWMNNPERGREFLDWAQAHGLRVIVYPWGSLPDMYGESMVVTDEVRQGITAQVNLWKGHPALLGWYMYDEPSGKPFQHPQRLKVVYELIKELDPYHPCFLTDHRLEGMSHYADCADVMVPDPYPHFDRTGFIEPLTKVSMHLDAVKNKPAWVTLQAFDWGDDGREGERAPSFKEFRAMAFLAVIHQAKGFVHFAHRYVVRYPSLDMAVSHVTRELDLMAPVILSSTERSVKVLPTASKSKVEAMAKEVNGQIYIVVVNTTDEAQSFRLQLDDMKLSGPLVVLGEYRTLQTQATGFSDKVEGYGVHLYTTETEHKKWPSIQTTQSGYDAAEAQRRKSGNLAVHMENDVKVTASSTAHNTIYDLRLAINGVIDEQGMEGWTAESPAFPHWLELRWTEKKTIGKVVLLGTTARDYEIQSWQGNKWNVIESIKDNEQTSRVHTFMPFSTDKIRLWITSSAEGRMTTVSEIECYSN